MKKILLSVAVILTSQSVFSQSLINYKTDQTSIQFNLTQIDSITFSAAPPLQAIEATNVLIEGIKDKEAKNNYSKKISIVSQLARQRDCVQKDSALVVRTEPCSSH